MKKRLGIISAVLVVALAIGLCFALLTSAATTDEAKLVLTPASGTAETLTGSYDQMVEKLNSSITSLGEGKAVLTLTADARATKALVLHGSGTETVEIDLAGYTLDLTGVSSTPIAVGGVLDFALKGGHSDRGDVGRVVSGNATEGLIDLSASEQLSAYEISDVEMVYASSGSSAILHEDDDELVLRYVDVTYAADANGAATEMVVANSGSLTLINSSIKDEKTATGATVGVAAKGGATVRFENTDVKADVAYSMQGATWLTAVNTEFEAKTAIFTASEAEGSLVNCLGVAFRGSILGEGVTADMIKLYYGTGSTLIDSDPTGKVTVATAYAKLTQLASGKWTLLENVSTEGIYTRIYDRGAVTEKNDKLSSAAAIMDDVSTEKVVVTFAFVTDKSYSTTAVSAFGESSNGNTSGFIDYNGFNITQTRASHFLNVKGLFRLTIDGADAEGKVGEFKHTAYNGGMIYVNKSNADSVLTMRNLNMLHTNACGSVDTTIATGAKKNNSSNMLQLQDSFVYMDNMQMKYNGANYGEGLKADTDTMTYDIYYKTSVSMNMVYQQDAIVTANNCSFIGAPEGKIVESNVPIATRAFAATTNASRTYAKNCIFDGIGGPASTNASTSAAITISDSTARNLTATAFIGSGTSYIHVADCDVELLAGKPLSSGKVKLLYGKGEMKITVASGDTLAGTHVCEEGSVIYYDRASEAYVMASGDMVTTVNTGKLFANGMVFQAGKPINVWGTCETDGAKITVSLGDKTATATVADGKWEATLPAMDYAKGLTLKITEEGKEIGDISFTKVDIGEVWILSGQSNANLGAYKMEDFEEYKALADLYDIRCFSVAAATAEAPLDDVKSAEWFNVTSSTVGRADTGCGISAVGYVMATRLAAELPGAPTVAVVDINYNGKAISNFISNEYDPYEGFSASYHTAHAESAHGIYNAMIAPLEGYNVSGFGWYQGEATYDSGECDATTDGNYGLNVDQLYATYTKTFNKNAGNAPLELFIVQLSAYMGNPSAIRSYQQNIAAKNEHYHLVSSSWAGSVLADKDFALDAGDGFQHGQVHAARKSPMGIAMGDSILENVYFKDKELDIANPEIEKIEIDGDKIKVTLDRDFTLMYGTSPEGFEISADGETWVAAKGVIEGRTITLTAASVAAPKYVRYAYAYSVIELENGEKLIFHKGDASITYKADPASSKATTVTITTGGKTYVIHTADSEIIRSMLPGNIVAKNGHTLPVFSSGYNSSSAGEN